MVKMDRTKFFVLQLAVVCSASIALFLVHQATLRLNTFPLASTLIVMTLFILGLLLLKKEMGFWQKSFLYWVTLLFLGQSLSDTIYWVGILPFLMTGPLILFLLWGIYQILSKELKNVCVSIGVNTILGRNTFLLATLLIFFGCFGAVGFLTSNPASILMSWLSWMMVPLGLNLFYKRLNTF